jgi:molecular chaperone IbpA
MTNLHLRSIDYLPNLNRFGVGFERMFDKIDETMRINQQGNSNYPPYNTIRLDDDHYTIEIAVAGFKQGEVSIQVEENRLTIDGKNQVDSTDTREFIHRGISGRDFSRIFTLADHVEVTGAKQENGILVISLERIIPVEKKPKQIAISYEA